MHRDEQVRLIEGSGIIAIVRFDRSEQLIQVAKAIKAGGVDIIEFTMTTPNALGIIEESTQEFGDEVLLGAGTVLDGATARAAILAGAEFIVAPTLDPEVIEVCRRYSKVVIPGAFTPTEILTAWQCGADFIKAGAAAVAVGGNLVKKRAIAEGNFGELTETARQFVAAIRGARGV